MIASHTTPSPHDTADADGQQEEASEHQDDASVEPPTLMVARHRIDTEAAVEPSLSEGLETPVLEDSDADSPAVPATVANSVPEGEGPPRQTARASKVRARVLTEKTRTLLHAPDKERIAHIQRDKFVPYKRADELLEKMEALLNHEMVSRPQNMIIVAASNNGKSTLLREFRDRHPGNESLWDDALHMPVLLLEAPSEPRKVEFESAMLTALRVDSRNVTDRKQIICDRLKLYRTRIILIDEVNSLLAGSAISQRKVINDIRWISNHSKAHIVLAGAPESLNFLKLDKHSGTRFVPHLMRRWKPTDKSFIKFLMTYEALLPLNRPGFRGGSTL